MCRTDVDKPSVVYCTRCNEPFSDGEDMFYTNDDEYWHMKCFVCAQCFRPFKSNHEYYEFGGRKYCEDDFKTLFAPCCGSCQRYITGRFIKALGKNWHPHCFNCQICNNSLVDQGFIKSNNQALCHNCNACQKVAAIGRYVCHKCKGYIDDEIPLKVKDQPYHAYHFNCHNCGIELNSQARTIENDLYCIKCHDKMGIPICGACRRPIEERVVTALGKHFHVEHFACTICERPFLGKPFFEKKNLAYCKEHFDQLFGYQCAVCRQSIKGDVVEALDKYWCDQHFSCTFCQSKLVVNKTKFHNVDSQPCCKKCFRKLPGRVRRRIEEDKKREKKLQKTLSKNSAQEVKG